MLSVKPELCIQEAQVSSPMWHLTRFDPKTNKQLKPRSENGSVVKHTLCIHMECPGSSPQHLMATPRHIGGQNPSDLNILEIGSKEIGSKAFHIFIGQLAQCALYL